MRISMPSLYSNIIKIRKFLYRLNYPWKSAILLAALLIFMRLFFISEINNQHSLDPNKKPPNTHIKIEQRGDEKTDIYKMRSELVRKSCLEHQSELEQKYLEVWPRENYKTVIRKADILVPSTKQFFWCKVPKVASESWTKLYINLWFPGKAKELMPKQQVFLARTWAPSRSVAFMRKINKNKFSYITVRHPFERILSAYRDKFFANGGARYEKMKEVRWYKRFGRRIIAEYRTTPPPESKYRRAPTFTEFISFLTELPVAKFDEHWKPMYIQCLPCHFQYNVIARLDSIKQDSDHILSTMGVSRSLVSSHTTQGNTTDNTVSTYYSTLNKHLIEKLYDIYKYDFIIFNYTMDSYKEFVQ